jgi:hypothetical protein
MKLFRTDPAASLQAAEMAVMQEEARVAEKQAERMRLIEQADGDEYVNAVVKINDEIARGHANIAAHRERIVAMQTKRHQQQLAGLAQEKAAGIAHVSAKLGKRLDAARKLQTILKQVGEAFCELLKAEEEAFNLPPSVSPLGALGHFRLDGIEELSARRMRRPPSAGIVRDVAEHGPFSFADIIETRNREVIEMLEGAPISTEDERDVA